MLPSWGKALAPVPATHASNAIEMDRGNMEVVATFEGKGDGNVGRHTRVRSFKAHLPNEEQPCGPQRHLSNGPIKICQLHLNKMWI